jgi:hypothetical protein
VNHPDQGAVVPPPSSLSQALRSSEIVLVGSLLLILFSVLLIAKTTAACSYTALDELTLPPHAPYPVTIDGAVKKPGIYQVLPGTPLKKIVKKSCPTRSADLKKIDLEALVEGPLEVHVGAITEIGVRIEGAVSAPLTLTLPVGTKVHDLRSKISLNPEADPTIFKSRRMLKDGEILTVPKKRG